MKFWIHTMLLMVGYCQWPSGKAIIVRSKLQDTLTVDILKALRYKEDLIMIVGVTSTARSDIKVFRLAERSLEIRASSKPLQTDYYETEIVWGGRGVTLLKNVPNEELVSLPPAHTLARKIEIKDFFAKGDNRTWLSVAYSDYARDDFDGSGRGSLRAQTSWLKVESLLKGGR